MLDLETTGTDPGWDEITEVGAVTVRGGERLGTFHTLVGGGWPTIDTVLPSLLEFVRDTVITGHNVQFDLRFLNAALARSGRPLLATDDVVDTMPLARRPVSPHRLTRPARETVTVSAAAPRVMMSRAFAAPYPSPKG